MSLFEILHLMGLGCLLLFVYTICEQTVKHSEKLNGIKNRLIDIEVTLQAMEACQEEYLASLEEEEEEDRSDFEINVESVLEDAT